MPGHRVAAQPPSLLPDALLVHRIACFGDAAALAELRARHGMSLYALSYSLTFDSDAAEAAVAVAFDAVRLGASAFTPERGSVGRWLTGLTRRAVEAGMGDGHRPAAAAY